MSRLLAILVLVCAATCAQTKQAPAPTGRWDCSTRSFIDDEDDGWKSNCSLGLSLQKGSVEFRVSIGRQAGIPKVAVEVLRGADRYFGFTMAEAKPYAYGYGKCELKDLFQKRARKRPGLPSEINSLLEGLACKEGPSLH